MAVVRDWYANKKIYDLYNIFEDLYFVHLNRQIAKIFAKFSKTLIKIVKDIFLIIKDYEFQSFCNDPQKTFKDLWFVCHNIETVERLHKGLQRSSYFKSL